MDEAAFDGLFYQTKCKLLSLDRRSFKRLLGPIESILKRNEIAYVKFIGN